MGPRLRKARLAYHDGQRGRATMSDLTVLMWLAQMLVVLLAISLGKNILAYKIRQEENKRKQLELSIMEKRARLLEEGKKIPVNLEDLLYRAQIQKEIDDILRKNMPR